ncbi:MAG: DUF997 family protein [Pirellulales bacterium]
MRVCHTLDASTVSRFALTVNDPTTPTNRVDPLVASSKREALFAASLWLAAIVYTVGYCSLFGYHRGADDLTFVLGIPDWVFWGIVTPWTVCTVVSIWFALRIMRDDPLGDEAATDPADAADGDADVSDAATQGGKASAAMGLGSRKESPRA